MDNANGLLEGITDLARLGPSDALHDALDELDRLLRHEGERLEQEPGARARLDQLQTLLGAASASFAVEQRRVGRELIALQSELHARARYALEPMASVTLDRRG